jgi:hypothetical protein
VSVPGLLGVTSIEPLAGFIPVNASLGLVSVPVLLALHTSPLLIAQASVAKFPWMMELGDTLMSGGGGAFTVRVAVAAVVGGGQVRV